MSKFEVFAMDKAGKRLSQLSTALRHPLHHLDLQAVLQKARQAGLMANDRSIAWKYLGGYLGRHFGPATRRKILADHYNFLLGCLHDGGARHDWAAGLTVWTNRGNAGDADYRITLAPSVRAPMEGESELTFTANGVMLGTLTFSFVDAEVAGVGGVGTTLFVGGVQGSIGCRAEIRAAARDNGEISPTAMLVIAAKALAEVFDATCILCTSNEQQVARVYAGEALMFDYDRLWTELGATQAGGGSFVIDPHEAAQRCLAHLSSAHRARARRKTALKDRLQAEMGANLTHTLYGAEIAVAA
jgi:uncharacterized protein VirK/YbjX